MKIAIIGAGIAGLRCAQILQLHGINVSIFEKSKRPSGRISTKFMDDWYCDHGAQYFTAKTLIFLKEIDIWKQNKIIDIWNPKIYVYENDIFENKSSPINRYVGVPSMSEIGKFMAKNLNIHYSKLINKIEKKSEGWILHFNESKTCDSFNWVIMAIPAPQAYPLIKNYTYEIEPLMVQANMKGCWTMMIKFNNSQNINYDAAFINQGPISWLANNKSKPNRENFDIWTINTNSNWSQKNINLKPFFVKKKIIKSLKEFGFTFENYDYKIHRWLYALSNKKVLKGSILNESKKIGICGDWLNGGRVEGAWLSGNELAFK